jgi:uncharacterized protein YciI
MADHDHFLHKELYVYFSTPVKPRDEVAEMLPKHLEYQVDLEKRGIMFGAGPMFENGAAAPHRGMIIVRAASFEEADKIAAADPMHLSGMREYALERWSMNEGTITLRVTYSDQVADII